MSMTPQNGYDMAMTTWLWLHNNIYNVVQTKQLSVNYCTTVNESFIADNQITNSKWKTIIVKFETK